MNLQLKASKSYWTSRRDEQFSLLDILLNKSCVGDNVEEVQNKINQTIREIAICIKAIEIVDGLIGHNQNPTENTEQEKNS